MSIKVKCYVNDMEIDKECHYNNLKEKTLYLLIEEVESIKLRAEERLLELKGE